ncbi:MAG TPA: sigma-54 dependent transcriptional regulator [Polyangiaceae bacterium]
MISGKWDPMALATPPPNFDVELWREAGTSRELSTSLPRITRLIEQAIPLLELVIFRVAPDSGQLSLVAAEPREPERIRVRRSDLELPARAALAAWGREGSVTAVGPGNVFATVFDAFPGVPLVSGPLLNRGSLSAVMVAALRPGARVESQQLDVLQRALGPLGAAFDNDERAFELTRLREALSADRQALSSQRQEISEVVIGEASGLRDVMERVELVATTNTPVLILGETGSGKEVIARAIHLRSNRAQGPVVRVNCGAIPPELVDSELFGHEKGSFTGAVGSRQGWFERASGGTLFLDEVGELPLAAQVRLLRVLQDGSLERVGGHKTLRVDVRVIAATHRRLEAMVQNHTFREDLWYRLNIFPIKLPALRERLEDIPALVRHFAAHAGQRVGAADLKPTTADLALLEAYTWPGNVRELAAVIERAAILGNGKRLDVARALGTAGGPRQGATAAAGPRGALEGLLHGPSGDVRIEEPGRALVTLDEAVVQHIERALTLTHGRIEGRAGAAHLLGVNPHTLRAKMRKLGIDWSRFRHDGQRASPNISGS